MVRESEIIKFFVAAVISVAFGLRLNAGEVSSDEAYDLGMVVVRDSRLPEDQTHAFDVITRAEIERLQPDSLGDLLNTFAGMHIRRGGKQEAYVRLRGFPKQSLLY